MILEILSNLNDSMKKIWTKEPTSSNKKVIYQLPSLFIQAKVQRERRLPLASSGTPTFVDFPMLHFLLRKAAHADLALSKAFLGGNSQAHSLLWKPEEDEKWLSPSRSKANIPRTPNPFQETGPGT